MYFFRLWKNLIIKLAGYRRNPYFTVFSSFSGLHTTNKCRSNVNQLRQLFIGHFSFKKIKIIYARLWSIDLKLIVWIFFSNQVVLNIGTSLKLQQCYL